VRLGQLLKSASFRLTAAYVGLFSVSVGILAGLIYFLATSGMQSEVRTRIAADSTALREEYARGGPPQLLQAIAERSAAGWSAVSTIRSTTRAASISLATCQWFLARVVGSHLQAAGWRRARGELEKLGVLVTPLAHGNCLLVGDDIGKVRKFGSLILRSFGWVFLLTATMAVAGGIFLSTRVLRRIEAINRTAEAIIEGDISRRIPRRGVPDDLDQLAATLNRMLDRMTSLMESLRHVSNDVAHDLRTPLGRLRRSLEEAGRTVSSPEESRAAIDSAVMEVDGILDTFGAILRIAQIESGSRRSNFCRLVLSGTRRGRVRDFRPVNGRGRKGVADPDSTGPRDTGRPRVVGPVTRQPAGKRNGAYVRRNSGNGIAQTPARRHRTLGRG